MKKIIKDVNLNDKKIFLRVDFNVPLSGDEILSSYRIDKTLDTIKEIISQNVQQLVIASHLGRPKGVDPSLSMLPIFSYLNSLFGGVFVFKTKIVSFTEKFVFLENLRFFEEEEMGFGDYFKLNYDIYIMDAFGICHRKTGSTYNLGIPVVMGLLMEKEIEACKHVSNVDVCIIGGSKISDKLPLIIKLSKKCKKLILVGGMCTTILKHVYHMEIGKSMCDDEFDVENFCKEMGITQHNLTKPNNKNLTNTGNIYLPIDFIVREDDKYYCADEISSEASIVDIGSTSMLYIANLIKNTKSIFWNGPPGIFENKESENGTCKVIKMLSSCYDNGIICYAGGGDTAAAVSKFGVYNKFTHVFTGGGTLLAFIEGKKLPGYDTISDL